MRNEEKPETCFTSEALAAMIHKELGSLPGTEVLGSTCKVLVLKDVATPVPEAELEPNTQTRKLQAI